MDYTKEYIKSAKTKTRQEFADMYKFPFLVMMTEIKSEPSTNNSVTINAKMEDLLNDSKGMEIRKIVPLIKTKKGLIADLITVGRLPSQDIVIDASKISKTHAYFKTKDNINYFVCDNASLNGTFLNNEKIPPNKEIEVKNNDIISFGNIFFKFFVSDFAYYTLKIFGKI